MKLRSTVRVAVMTAAVSLALLPLPTPAHAGGGCNPGDWIEINKGAGAEAPSWQRGHKHITGNHYVKEITSTGILWYADNNGGSDGDTTDTRYEHTYCNH
ncbi:hypothetical protein ABT023_26110 [Micromonospora sp. NPDC002296]|uniref:hypothetical protein n=1 Tax=Micromonospora sp. NPDC002296 TaxID=3154271 RepID=UPI00332E86BE